jgi:hypothetical protein
MLPNSLAATRQSANWLEAIEFSDAFEAVALNGDPV